MIDAVNVLGEWRLVEDGSVIGPDTVGHGGNTSILRALRELPRAPERDSIGYVWPSRQEAVNAARHACHRGGEWYAIDFH